MSQLMRFPSAVKRDPAIEVWMHKHSGELGGIAQRWFEVMRAVETTFESYCMTVIRPRV